MIKFYATFAATDVRKWIPAGTSVLLPASSFARNRRKDGSLPTPPLPAHITDRAADSGGFVATKIWGDYKYTPQEYVTWLKTFNPSWAATMDYCCEREVAETEGIVRERQEKTTEMAWHFWTHFRDVPWCWVPTIQGWARSDYEVHAEELSPLLTEMQTYYGTKSAWRAGVGTLCQRAKKDVIQDVVDAVAWAVPGVPLHLWGVKGAAITPNLPGQVVSTDSAAWTWGANTNRRGTALSQREYSIQVQLPEFEDKFYARQRGIRR